MALGIYDVFLSLKFYSVSKLQDRNVFINASFEVGVQWRQQLITICRLIHVQKASNMLNAAMQNETIS